jgi:uncharacterized protein (UPF0248 family)
MSIYRIIQNLANEKFAQCKIKGKDFEEIFEQKLIEEGFSTVEFEIDKELKKVILSSDTQIPNHTDLIGYVKEPFNSQSFPDFLVLNKSNIIPIELKTSEDTDKPMWNNSVPKQNAIYLFMAYSCVPEKREVLYFRGCDVITKEASDILKQRLIEAQEQSKFTKEELAKLDVYNHGWDIYVRANYQQKIHISDTNPSFVNHPNKEANKRKVLDYLRSFDIEKETITM